MPTYKALYIFKGKDKHLENTMNRKNKFKAKLVGYNKVLSKYIGILCANAQIMADSYTSIWLCYLLGKRRHKQLCCTTLSSAVSLVYQ